MTCVQEQLKQQRIAEREAKEMQRAAEREAKEKERKKRAKDEEKRRAKEEAAQQKEQERLRKVLRDCSSGTGPLHRQPAGGQFRACMLVTGCFMPGVSPRRLVYAPDWLRAICQALALAVTIDARAGRELSWRQCPLE